MAYMSRGIPNLIFLFLEISAVVRTFCAGRNLPDEMKNQDRGRWSYTMGNRHNSWAFIMVK